MLRILSIITDMLLRQFGIQRIQEALPRAPLRQLDGRRLHQVLRVSAGGAGAQVRGQLRAQSGYEIRPNSHGS